MELKMKAFKISLIYFCFALASCADKANLEQNSLFTIKASFSKEMKLNLSDFAESIEFIPLETDDDCLIGKALKIRYFNNKYYIGSASMQMDRIFVFSENGKYLYQLYKRGLGPDEYTEIEDFDIIDNSNIVVLSYSDPKILIYNLEQNICVLNKRLDVFPRNLAVLNNRFYLYNLGVESSQSNGTYNHTAYSFEELDLQGNALGSFHEIDDISRTTTYYYSIFNNFDLNKDRLYFNFPLSNIIYEIIDNRLIPSFDIDFGNKKLKENIFDGNIQSPLDIVKAIRQYEGVYHIDLFNVTSEFLFFDFFDFEHNGYIVLHNFEKNKTLIGHQIIDDIFFIGNKFSPNKFMDLPMGKSENEIIWQIDAAYLKDVYEKYKKSSNPEEMLIFQKEHKDLAIICENIKEDDNPILAKIKIRTK
jgi:hypothetical protein